MVKWSLKFPPLSQNISCFYCVVIVGDFYHFFLSAPREVVLQWSAAAVSALCLDSPLWSRARKRRERPSRGKAARKEQRSVRCCILWFLSNPKLHIWDKYKYRDIVFFQNKMDQEQGHLVTLTVKAWLCQNNDCNRKSEHIVFYFDRRDDSGSRL